MRRRGDRLLLADGFQRAYVCDLARAWGRGGRRVTVIGGDAHAELARARGVRFLNLRGEDSPDRSVLRKIVDLVRFEARTLAHVARSPAGWVYHLGIGKRWVDRVFANLAYLCLGKRVIHTVHDLLPHDRVTLMDRIEHVLIYRLAARHLVVHTEFLKRGLVERFGVSPDRVTVAPHGTYLPPDHPELDRAAARQRLGLAPDRRVVLCFGWQRPYKGTHLLLEALADDWPAGLIVVVRGEAHEEYARQLERLVQERGLGERVRAQFGRADDDEMEALFKAADVVALPYLEGSQSGVLFMAYAYGRPVLASDIGGFPEYIQPGRTGEIFACGDRAGLRRALVSMLEAPERYDAGAIRAYAYGHHSWGHCASAVDAIVRPTPLPPAARPRRGPLRLTGGSRALALRLAKLALALVQGAFDRVCSLVGARPGRFAILYYHTVVDADRAQFARQLDALARRFRVVRPDYDGPVRRGDRLVAITFDDGLASVAHNALPELAARGLPWGIFVPSAAVGRRAGWAGADGEMLMSEMELQALSPDMVLVGSHSETHPRLPELPAADAARELVASKRRLESLLGRAVDTFSFPHGEYTPQLVRQAREAGYRRLFTIEPRLALREPCEALTGRFDASPRDGAIELALKASGSYRYLAWAFRVARTLRSVARAPVVPARLSNASSAAAVHTTAERTVPASAVDRRYVILTAARNEAGYIERTIASVAAQTIAPHRWVLVDDGSTDETPRLLERLVAETGYASVLTRGGTRGHSFGSKVVALQAAYDSVRDAEFSYVAVLDADVELPRGYYADAIAAFERDETLGVCGGWIVEDDGTGRVAPRPGNRVASVAGAVQVFRRACFDRIGGIPRMPWGNEDTVACTLAEMRGWRAESFPALPALHLKPRSRAGALALLRGALREGMSDYDAGYHPAYLVAKAARRVRERPAVLASAARLAGYALRAASGRRRPVSDDVVAFVRRKQLKCILSLLCGGAARD